MIFTAAAAVTHELDNGIISATACVVGFNDNCTNSYDISFKECDTEGVTVYHLVPTEAASEGYCVGG